MTHNDNGVKKRGRQAVLVDRTNQHVAILCFANGNPVTSDGTALLGIAQQIPKPAEHEHADARLTMTEIESFHRPVCKCNEVDLASLHWEPR